MTEQQYIDYFEKIARQHVKIRHSGGNRAFFVVSDDNMKELDLAVRSELSFPALLLDEYIDDQLLGQDNARVRLHGGFSVICSVEKGDRQSVREARMLARQIAQSILYRIRKDALPGGELSALWMVNETEYPGEKTPVLDGKATGWAYPFAWLFPTKVAVDPADWDTTA